ncbi:MAG: bifunctional hexulose-6-phosphate synthase/ribonuclease regulator [Candidatus Altiarchaeales archaeon HGW-Altiarchaeales-3]|nr:MAG: bifunctional hexulose-6-phosphate synthase/ribonuclease regulator [Candidatus Altiarchaeales archaeon HGW-Altiarchaeales-3]
MKPIIQVALDLVDLPRAMQIAKESAAGGVDWIEAGTPLIKSEGMNAVREIKKNFNKITVADLKTMDCGRCEVEMAAKSGADIAVLLGASDDSTIIDAVCAGKNYGCKIMVDLINIGDMQKRALELEKLGVDYICIHVGVDQQMKGIDALIELEKIAKSVKIPIAIAGGINSETAPAAVKAGASIIIVGGAITKAKDAKIATELIKNSIDTGIPIKTELYKKFIDPKEVFEKVSCANISDAMHRTGEMQDIKPLFSGIKMIGQAVTVRTYPGDWAKTVEAIDIAKAGEVIVVDAGCGRTAVWGELATQSCIQKGINGIVIDGAVRDTEEIKELKFPVFTRFVTPAAGEPKGFGEINVSIKCGGVMVREGDWIVGDDDGVVVVPMEKAIEIANRALDVLERENRLREEIKRGSTLSKVAGLKKWEKV